METNEEQVSRNIKSIRNKLGLSQQDIAKDLNITSKTYMAMENHPFSYSIDKLNILANYFGCNINEFFLPIQFTKSEYKCKQK